MTSMVFHQSHVTQWHSFFTMISSPAWADSKLHQRNPALLPRAQIPQSNIGQVAHVSPTPWVTSQEADITRRAPEAACWLRLGCWSNNAANSQPSLGPFNSRVLLSCLVPQCSYPPHWPAINDVLWIVTGCLRPTPADNLPILAGIQPAKHERMGKHFTRGAGRKKFALKITIFPKNKQCALKITFLFNPNGAWNLM